MENKKTIVCFQSGSRVIRFDFHYNDEENLIEQISKWLSKNIKDIICWEFATERKKNEQYKTAV